VTDLSPAAQAVLDAAFTLADNLDRDVTEMEMIAAALRAAADQVVPAQNEPPCGEGEPWPQSYQLMADSKWEQRQKTRDELLAIAAELERAGARSSNWFGKALGSAMRSDPSPPRTGATR